MTLLRKLTALVFLCVLAACGNNSNSTNVNGNWTASLKDNSGTAVFGFTTSLTESSNNSLTVTNLNFSTQSNCFSNGATATGAVTLTGTTNGVTGQGFQLTVTSNGSNTNTLALNGTITNSTISGTWTLAGLTSGCTGSGNFTMTHS